MTDNNSYSKNVLNFAKEHYGTEPEYLWLSAPNYAVLRHSDNRKWYGIIMDVPRDKLGLSGTERVDILDIKCDPIMIGSLLSENGFLPAYHMHKGNWITVLLDGSADLETIYFLLDTSFEITQSCVSKRKNGRGEKREWIVPANPKYYNLEKAFSENDAIMWKQSSNIAVGDIVYLYVAAPVSSIRYKCEAVEVDIPYKYSDENVSMSRVMKIKLLHKFDEGQLDFDKLKEYGVRAVRGPRSIPIRLRNYINKLCEEV